MNKALYTVLTFTKINTKRFFRDRLSIFFSLAFPLILLFVFGALFNGGGSLSFSVALINNADSQFAREYAAQAKKSDILEVDPEAASLEQAKDKMSRGQLSAAIVLPEGFGDTRGQNPGGEAIVYYTQNNQQAAQTLTSVLESQFEEINARFVETDVPFTVTSEQLNQRSLSQFDYAFAGLIGFAIIGIGIFGPMNVFPELKKMGILRRLHTTPLRVWQYFLSTALSQAIIGLLVVATMFAVGILVFDLQVAVGNLPVLLPYVILSIITILGIGLAIGGWASNERQAAPLGNIVVFPLFFLSGVFFPRFIMPEWLQAISGYLPLTPVIDGIRMLAIEAQPLTAVLPQLALLVAWAIVIYAIAFRVFRWE